MSVVLFSLTHNGWCMLRSGFRSAFLSDRTKLRNENPQFAHHQTPLCNMHIVTARFFVLIHFFSHYLLILSGSRNLSFGSLFIKLSLTCRLKPSQ